MSNESIIQVPPNVGEPIVLQRFLLRLVVELDILLGKRASSTNDAYVTQQDLISIGKELTSAIELAQKQLDEAVLLLEDTTDTNVDDIKDEQVTQNARLDGLDNFAWLRAFTIGFQGRSTNGVVITNTDYNIESGLRTAVGVYEFELTKVSSTGVDILDHTQYIPSFSIASSATSQSYYVHFEVIDASLGTFRVKTYAVVQGAGNALAHAAYDPLSTDNVNVIGMFTPLGSAVPS